jgi:hypothetical protein
MARKRKTAAKRLRQEIERVRTSRPVSRQWRKVARLPDPDWTDKRIRGTYANAVLTLDAEPAHSPLRKAFQNFDLDPADPFNWRLLLTGLAEIFFAPALPRGPRGARPKWDEPRRLLFKTHVAMARKQLLNRHGQLPPTDEDVADYLHLTWPDQYGFIAIGTIRKYIVSEPPKGRR